MPFVFEDENPRFVFEEEPVSTPVRKKITAEREPWGVEDTARTTAAVLGGFAALPVAGIGGLSRLITTGDLGEATKTIEQIASVPSQLLETERQKQTAQNVGEILSWPFVTSGKGWGGIAELSQTGDLQKAVDVIEGRSAGSSYLVPTVETVGEIAPMFLLGGLRGEKAVPEKAIKPPVTEEAIKPIDLLSRDRLYELTQEIPAAKAEMPKERFVFELEKSSDEKIVQSFLENKPSAIEKGETQHVRFTGGPPASGKSTGLGDRKNFVEVNSDFIKDKFGKDHEESSALAKEVFTRALEKGNDIIYDSQLTNFPLVDDAIQKVLSRNGYVEINFTNIDAETSQVRARARNLKNETKRTVPASASVKGYNTALPSFIELYKKYKNNPNVDFILSDNNVDFRKPVIVFDQYEGKTTIRNKKLFDELMQTRYKEVRNKQGEVRYERETKVSEASLSQETIEKRAAAQPKPQEYERGFPPAQKPVEEVIPKTEKTEVGPQTVMPGMTYGETFGLRPTETEWGELTKTAGKGPKTAEMFEEKPVEKLKAIKKPSIFEAMAAEEPTNAAILDIKKRGGLNLDSLKKEYDADTVKELLNKRPGIASKKGKLTLDVAAEDYNFAGGDELMNAILGAKSKKAIAKAEREKFEMSPQGREYELAKKGYTPVKGVRGDELYVGDKVMVEGEVFQVKKFDAEENAILEDGRTMKVGMYERIPAEGIKREKKAVKPPPVKKKPQEPAELKPEERPETKPIPAEEKPKYAVSPTEIPRDLAERAYQGTSWTPESRADAAQKSYASEVQAVYDELSKFAKTSAQKEVLDSEMARFKERYLAKTKDLLAARSRIVSPMIAGPSKFPVRTMEKRNAAELKKLNDLIETKDKAIASIKSKLKAAYVEERGGELEVAKEKLGKLKSRHEMMLSANKIVKNKKLSNEEKVKQLVESLKIQETTAQKILKPDFAGRIGFPSYELTNSLANIKNTERRIATLEQRAATKEAVPQKETERKGVRVVENAEENRLQLFFDEKPTSEVITQLKSQGFRWSPKSGAWQRQLTENAKRAADFIFEKTKGYEELAVEQKAAETRGSISVARIGEEVPATVRFEPAIEKRYQAAKTNPKDTMIAHFKNFATDLVHKLSRTYEHLPRTEEFAEAGFALKRLEKQKGVTGYKAIIEKADELAGLNKADYDIFSRKVILDDLNYEAEQGHALPFGFTEETLKAESGKIETTVSTNPRVQAALKKRKASWDKLKAEMQNMKDYLGYVPEERFKNPAYFRHQVLEYANAKGIWGTGKRLKAPTGRGFLKERKGSALDINTDYLEAEYEVYGQMLMDVEIAKTLKHIDKNYSIAREIKGKSKEKNFENLVGGPQVVNRIRTLEGELAELKTGEVDSGVRKQMKVITDQLNELDPTRPFKQKMAIGFSRLEKMGIDVSDYYGDVEGPVFTRLAKMMKEPGEHQMPIGSIFKAIAEREKYIQEELGKKYMQWKQAIDPRMVPEGYATWQPREGNIFYFTDSIPAKLAEQLYSGVLEEAGITKEMLNKTLAMGGPRKQYVIKQELADTLNKLQRDRNRGWISEGSRDIQRAWKIWQLVSPRRWAKYNIRNLTGDADAAFVGNPSGFSKVPRAVSDLWDAYVNKKKMSPELQEWFERGGMEATLQAQEMGELKDLWVFKRLYDQKKGAADLPKEMWQKYWKAARTTTDFRESILRYANYLDYKEQMGKSKDGLPRNFGASMPQEIIGLKDIRDRAFWLSNDLLGAYDRVSVFGQAMREHVFPFWSWKEVNFKRYKQFVKNAIDNGELPELLGKKVVGTAIKSPYLAFRVGSFLLKATAFWSALQVWNHTRFPNEESELPESIKQQPHIILGRDKNGEIQYFNRIGALGDLLEWFGLDAAPHVVDKWMKGKVSLKEAATEQAKELGKGPVNVFAQGSVPLTKLAFETATRRSTFPDIFTPGTIRDRGLHIARSFGLENEYIALTGKPSKGYLKSTPKTIIYSVDPMEGSYRDVFDMKQEFMKKIGKGAEGFWLTPKGDALYNMKLALRYGDDKAFLKYGEEYIRLSGSMEKAREGIRNSLKNMDPLSGMNEKEKKAFVQSLKEDDQKKLTKAYKFYQNVLLGEKAAQEKKAIR